MNKTVNQAFNKQVNRELHSAYLYAGMVEWLTQKGYNGSAHWMNVQVQEEIAHAKGLIEWIRRMDGKVEYPAIEQVSYDYKNIVEVFEAALDHEQKITGWIDELTEVAKKEDDKASNRFLTWYIMEQVEEEENARDNVAAFTCCQDDVAALFKYDAHLGGREFHAPHIPYLD